MLLLSFLLWPKETKQRKACRGLTRRLRRGVFFFYKGLNAYWNFTLYGKWRLLRPLRTEPTTGMVWLRHGVYGGRWIGGFMFVRRWMVCGFKGVCFLLCIIDANCSLLAAERSRSGRGALSFLFFSFLLFSPQTPEGAFWLLVFGRLGLRGGQWIG